MATDQPYNELGQILSEGGEIALGLAFARGQSDSQIAILFARRFEPIRNSDAARLRELAERGVAAGNDLNELGPGDPIDISGIPTVSELFGDDPEGRRFFFIVEVDISGDGEWRELRLELSDFTSQDQLRDEANELASLRSTKSPGKFGAVNEEIEGDLPMRVVLGFKRF